MSRAVCGFAFLLCIVGCDDDGGTTDPVDAGSDSGDGGQGTRDMFPDVAPDAGPEPCIDDGECPDDSYCRPDLDGIESFCVSPGCKTGEHDDCGERMACDPEARTCERTEACEGDEHCLDGWFCDMGDNRCRAGCRVLEEDLCPFDDFGNEQRCDPETHRCARIRPCCDGETCRLALPSQCDSPVDEESCFNPNPCEDRCDADEDCEDADDYCDEDRFCRRGCRDGGCPGGAACNLRSRACELTGCDNDGDCAEGSFCTDEGQCALGCRVEPDTCPEGLFCGPAHQCGAGCDSDRQCEVRNALGWYCVRGECAPPCRLDSDCGGGEICEDGRCADGCRGDAFEPNDVRAMSQRLELDEDGEHDEALALAACPDDRDWFHFDAPAGWNVEVTVHFTHALGDLDARLYPPGEDARAIEGGSQTDDEVFAGVAEEAGQWDLEVFARAGGTNNYTLTVRVSPPEACVPDGDEEAVGNNTAGDALELDAGGARGDQRLRNRTVCEGDEDWYAIQLGQGDALRVRLFLRGNGVDENHELEFEVYGPGLPGPDDEPAFLPNNQGGGGAMLRFVEFSAPLGAPQVEAGTYFIRVLGLDETQWGSYELRVEYERFRELCLEDDAEPNADADEAHDLMGVAGFTRRHIAGGVELIPDIFHVLEGRTLCGDEDWYSVELRAGDDLDVAIVRNEAVVLGDIEIDIRDADGAVVGNPGRNARRDNSATAVDLAAGTYWVRVGAVLPEIESLYELTLLRTAEGAGECPADRFDRLQPNENRAQARRIEPGVLDNLILCGGDGDEDWYVFQVDGVADLTIAIEFDQLQADLELDVYREGQDDAENVDAVGGHSHSDDELVELNDRLPGRYFVRVSALNPDHAFYSLRVEIDERVFVCEDDPDESNDAFDDAVDLGEALVERDSQWLCDRVPADVDTFRIDVAGNVTRTIAAQFLFGDDGDLALDVYDAEGMLVGTTSGVSRNNSKQCIVIEPFGGDRVIYFQVVSLAINRINDDDERLDYTLVVQDGETCDDIEPPTPGVAWPSVPPPF